MTQEEKRRRNNLEGSILLAFTAAIWGSGFVAQKLGMDYMGPLLFNGTRMLLAGIVLMPVSAITIRRSGFPMDDGFKIGLRGGIVCGVVITLASAFQQISINMISVGKSGFLSALYVIFVPLIGMVMGQRAARKIWFCVFLAIFGFWLLSFRGGSDGIGAGDLIMVVSAFLYAMQIICVNHYVDSTDAVFLTMIQMTICGILNIAASFIFEDPHMSQITAGWPALLYSGLAPGAFGFTMQMVGQKRTDPTIASMVMSLESVFAALFGVLFLHEAMSGREITGCLVIFAAIIIAQLPDRRPGAERE